MITFDIVIDNDPSAVGGFLEYRYIQPDGTPSAWVVNTQVGTPGFGYFAMSGPTTTLLGVSGNPLPGPAEFRPNTVYQFRVKQICGIDGTELYSPIDGDYYAAECPVYNIKQGVFDPVLGAYPIEVSVVVAPNTGSVLSYTFDIYNASIDPTISVGNISESSSTVESNLPYTIVFDDNNVAGGIVQGDTYQVELTVTIVTSTQEELEICNRQSITIGDCYTWKILTGDSWYVEWLDCNGNNLSCGNLQPNNNLFICSPFQPVVRWCDAGVKKPSVIDPGTGLPTKGGLVVLPNSGPCDPLVYSYNPAGPTLNGSLCTACPF